MIPVFLDCDTGIDDALTIAYLLARPEVDLVGVGSVMGNVSAELGARNTLDLLSLAGRADVPVAVGTADPLVGRFDGGSPEVHGENGIGGVRLPRAESEPTGETAAAMLSRLARTHEGLRVLAVGPLTNLALALQADPELPSLVHDVTIMGGAAMVPGNLSPAAEANIGHDPEAAAAVFEAPWRVTVVGLDVTMGCVFEERHRSALAEAAGAVPRALTAMLATYFAYYRPVFGRASCALHDPLAAAIGIGALATPLAPTVPIVIDATDGPNRGRTTADLRGRFAGYPPIDGARHRVVLQVAEGFPDDLLAALLT
ncbi:nucleoside hydrolase [uncultured Amnibacterium sp.]|uniref:nucleoside hydrolase n=1 Tax=uncultured Amnibacterium sp. TaxID=1631851 RepID=UPI0035C988E5